MPNDRTFPPPDEFARRAHVSSMEQYRALYEHADKHPSKFWGQLAETELHWHQKWSSVFDWQFPIVRWFVGGKLNAAYNCVDRHLDTHRRNKVALIWEGEPGDQRMISYLELQPARVPLRQRAEGARTEERRSRGYLYAHGPRTSRRHAGLRADRRDS